MDNKERNDDAVTRVNSGDREAMKPPAVSVKEASTTSPDEGECQEYNWIGGGNTDVRSGTRQASTSQLNGRNCGRVQWIFNRVRLSMSLARILPEGQYKRKRPNICLHTCMEN